MEFELTAVAGDGLVLEVPAAFFSYEANDRLERLGSTDGNVYYQFWRLRHHVGVYLQKGPVLSLRGRVWII